MWNNCRCNHPCPIFCCRLGTCTNDVVNPILGRDFGFFSNTSAGEIAPSAIIPVSFVLGEGTSIVQSGTTTGAVALAQGTYEVSYFANAVLPAGGNASVALRLDGNIVDGSQVNVTGDAGQILPISQTVMLTVVQGGTLELVNTSTEAPTVNLASLSIKKL